MSRPKSCRRGPIPKDWEEYLDWLKVECYCRCCREMEL